MSDRTVSASRVVAASPATVFAILSDPRQHQRIDGSGTVKGGVVGPDRLSKGATFGMDMRMGAPYKVRNIVVEFEPDRLIAWKHFSPHRWRYELEPVDGGTRVTETWDATRVPASGFLLLRLLGFPAKSRRGIESTLVKLAEAAEADEQGTARGDTSDTD